MERKEVALLLRKIDIYYEGRIKAHDPKERFEAWASELADMEFSRADENLKLFIKDNHFPPTLADIIRGPKVVSRAIPGFEETRQYLEERDKRKPADAATREAALKKMREVLGIEREGDGLK